MLFLLLKIDVKSALGKKRKDGKTASLQPLTTIQRVYIGRLVETYGDGYQVYFNFLFMFMEL